MFILIFFLLVLRLVLILSEQVSLPDGWPSQGQIEFDSVTLSYDLGLEPVLVNATFTIKGGEKVCGYLVLFFF